MNPTDPDKHTQPITCSRQIDPLETLQKIRRELVGQFLERESVIDGMLCALLSGNHILILGPPGTGKSELAHELCRRIFGANYFQWLLTRFTTPEELFGPISLKALERDQYTRVTTGKLPRAHIAFLDEVFKASSAILNALLSLMNERRFHGGDGAQNGPNGGPEEVPLISLVGATNELPEDDELLALFDRFLLRFDVSYIKEDYLFLRMLALQPANERTIITLSELLELQSRAARIEIPEPVFRDLLELRTWLASKGIVASDRRYRQSLSALRTHALILGRAQCTSDDLDILQHVLWNAPEERKDIEQGLQALAFGHENEAQNLLYQAREIAELAHSNRPSADQANVIEALAKLHDLSRQLESLRQESERRGKRVSAVIKCHEETKRLLHGLLIDSELNGESDSDDSLESDETDLDPGDEPSQTH